MDKIIIVFGTRPELIKLLSVFDTINKQDLRQHFIIINTAQHHKLLDEILQVFKMNPDYCIPEKNHNNSLSRSFSYLFDELQKIIQKLLRENNIRMIIAQGDTTSCSIAAMISFLNEIPFGHIEAGLRSFNLKSPFPEEYYRKIITLSTHIHFTPTALSKKQLIEEGINENNIMLTGNTIVDAIPLINKMADNCCVHNKLIKFLHKDNNVLITLHRRENQNGQFNLFVEALKALARKYPDINFIWIKHPNPFIQKYLLKQSFIDEHNVHLVPPLSVFDMYKLFKHTKLIITDSGGIQEEAPAFNIPVMVFRKHTERMESVDMGYSVMAYESSEDIVNKFNTLIHYKYLSMTNPYGDGRAAERIIRYLKEKVLID